MSDHPIIRATPAFGDFYRQEYREVLGLAYVLCRNRSVAEEMVQEAFAAAFRRWDNVSQMESPQGWVRKVVANRSVSRFRRLAAETKALMRMHGEQATPPITTDTIAVWDAIRRLSTRQAEVVVLVYFAGLSHVETARLLGCGVETVRTHLKRAKTRLANMLGDEA